MANFSDLIAQTNARNKELHSMTVRVPDVIKSFIDELTNNYGLSRQEVLLSLVESGRDVARAELDKLDKSVVQEPKENSVQKKFFLLNTNKGNGDEDQDFMLSRQAAAAFYAPWKHYIEEIKAGDVVFLYQNQVGIIAYGTGTGKIEKADHEGKKDECFYQVLDGFTKLDKPMKAADITSSLDTRPVFLKTLSPLREGDKLLVAINEKQKIVNAP